MPSAPDPGGGARALDQAEITDRLDLGALAASRREPTLTGTAIEELMLAICRETGLPTPEVNAFVVLPDGGPADRADFVWRAYRLIVETDGKRTHRTNRAFEDDRLRDQRATWAGWRVVRITWRQLTEERERIRALLSDLLSARAP